MALRPSGKRVLAQRNLSLKRSGPFKRQATRACIWCHPKEHGRTSLESLVRFLTFRRLPRNSARRCTRSIPATRPRAGWSRISRARSRPCAAGSRAETSPRELGSSVGLCLCRHVGWQRCVSILQPFERYALAGMSGGLLLETGHVDLDTCLCGHSRIGIY